MNINLMPQKTWTILKLYELKLNILWSIGVGGE